jgi:hypothetical protein
MEALQRLLEINLEWANIMNLHHAFIPILPWHLFLIPCQHCTANTYTLKTQQPHWTNIFYTTYILYI